MDRRDDIAEETRGRDLPRARQRRDRESGGGEDAEDRGEDQRACINRVDRWRGNLVAEEMADGERHDRAEYQSGQHRQQCNRHHLQEEGEENEPAFRAHRFQGRDLFAFAVEEGADRLSRADARNGERGQSHQCQEHRNLFDEALCARRGIGAVAQLPARIGESRVGLFAERLHIRAGRHRHAIVIIDQAADGDEAGALERIHRHHHMRPEAEPAGQPIRFAGEHSVDAEILRADAQRVAALHVQMIE